ncbi:MAG: nucleotidyltransferase family protein, partial [Candidatus Aramenus sp.]|nr:nucleotidyltransferase family protein [Candidatus Aramenus sp.]
MYPMKAIILAGGFGKRLRPLTDDKPKPMVEIAGRPIIEWQVIWLKSLGIRTFVVSEGYKKETLINWLTDNEERLGVRFIHVVENEPLGTGGAVKKAMEVIDDDFVVVNGDIITNIDVRKLNVDECVATISLVPLRSPYGVVQTNDGKIVKFVEKPVLKVFW